MISIVPKINSDFFSNLQSLIWLTSIEKIDSIVIQNLQYCYWLLIVTDQYITLLVLLIINTYKLCMPVSTPLHLSSTVPLLETKLFTLDSHANSLIIFKMQLLHIVIVCTINWLY